MTINLTGLGIDYGAILPEPCIEQEFEADGGRKTPVATAIEVHSPVAATRTEPFLAIEFSVDGTEIIASANDLARSAMGDIDAMLDNLAERYDAITPHRQQATAAPN